MPARHWPVYIASKGRPSCPTAKLLAGAQRQVTVVVERQEADAYGAELAAGAALHQLELSDQGIAYVRNAILGAEQGWHWMLDDDVTRAYRASGGKCHPAPLHEVLAQAEAAAFALPGDVAQLALEYQQFAWSAKRPGWRVNSYCDVVVANHGSRARAAGASYVGELALKEDRDFTIQLLAAGRLTARSRHLAFSAPKNGSNGGGLAPLYATDGREATASRRMEARWPGVCTFNEKADGRPDVKIDWARFKPRPELLAVLRAAGCA